MRFNKYQLGAMIALPLAIMLNPMVIAIYLDYVTLVLEVIGMACVVYLCGFLLVKVLKPEPVKIPGKGATTLKAGKLIET